MIPQIKNFFNPKDVDIKQFTKLNLSDKAKTVLVGIAVSIFTLGILTPRAVKLCIKRFNPGELEKRVDKTAEIIKPMVQEQKLADPKKEEPVAPKEKEPASSINQPESNEPSFGNTPQQPDVNTAQQQDGNAPELPASFSYSFGQPFGLPQSNSPQTDEQENKEELPASSEQPIAPQEKKEELPETQNTSSVQVAPEEKKEELPASDPLLQNQPIIQSSIQKDSKIKKTISAELIIPTYAYINNHDFSEKVTKLLKKDTVLLPKGWTAETIDGSKTTKIFAKGKVIYSVTQADDDKYTLRKV